MAQYSEKIVGVDGGFPEYRHARDEMIRPVTHPIGEHPEGIEFTPTYPVDVAPPPPEDEAKAKAKKAEDASKAKTPEDPHKAKAPEEHHKAKTPEDASKHPTG
jgi:hypothetical protein